MQKKLTVTVVIPTYLREKELCDTVRAILEQSWPADEVIVIDQTPQHVPETEQLLHQLQTQGKIRLVRQEKPNLAIARNRGLKEARSDIVIYIDDDVALRENFVYEHVKNYEQDETLDAVCGQMLIPTQPNPTDTIPEFIFSSPTGWLFSRTTIPQESKFRCLWVRIFP